MKKTAFKAFLLMLAVTGSFVLLTSMKSSTTPTPNATNGDIKLTDLPLNRKAVNLKNPDKMYKWNEFPLRQQGFLWNESDSKTKLWRPQGITTITEDNRDFVIVSWYGRPKFNIETNPKGHLSENYVDRGARISIVDITRMKNKSSEPNYRHVLLVDKSNKPFHDGGGVKNTMHAGGIAVVDGKLHVADSRKKHRLIRVFDLNKIKKVDKSIKKYKYILVEDYSYKSPIKPSFLSYDKDRQELLIGAFNENPSDNNFLVWFKAPKNATEATAFNEKNVNVYRLPNKYKKIQGITSMTDPDDASKQILWLSTSFGRANRSNLYKIQVDGAANTPATSTSPFTEANSKLLTPTESKGAKYPPGLEDANISDDKQLWLLTEFHYDEGSYHNLKEASGGTGVKNKKTRRAVFALDYNQDL